MHAVIAVGLALSVAGCDWVLGLNRDREIDAAANLVTGTLKQRYVSNDESFAPLAGERIYEPAVVGFVVTFDDSSVANVEYLPDGTFSFETPMPGQPYRIAVTAEGMRTEYQHTASHLKLASLTAGHPVRQTVVPTNLQFAYPPVATATSGARITSTGIYTSTESGLYGPSVTFDWRLALPANGASPGMLDAAQHDRVYAIEYVTDSTTFPSAPPYSTIRSVSSASLTQVQGVTAMLPTPMPITRNTCVRIMTTNATEYARITAADPRPNLVSNADWTIFAAPAPDTVGIVGASWLAVSGHSPAMNLDLAPTFHDPYVGMTLIATTAAAATFRVQLPSSLPLQLSNITRRYERVEPGTPAACGPPTTIVATVGIPGAITLDDIPLDTDGRVVDLDLTRDVRIAWSLIAAGPVDVYTYALHELIVVGGVTTQVARRGALIAGQSTAVLDALLLIPGHTYMIVISANIGRPASATGDFETVQLPFETTAMWSHSFEVRAR